MSRNSGREDHFLLSNNGKNDLIFSSNSIKNIISSDKNSIKPKDYNKFIQPFKSQHRREVVDLKWPNSDKKTSQMDTLDKTKDFKSLKVEIPNVKSKTDFYRPTTYQSTSTVHKSIDSTSLMFLTPSTQSKVYTSIPKSRESKVIK